MTNQQPSVIELSSLPNFPSRRKYSRFRFMRAVDWDFFMAASGVKQGFLENLSESGCLLRTSELIEHRRWIRLVVKEPQNNIWFSIVGRIVRCEDRMESWDNWNVTLYRYGVEFTQAINPLVLRKTKEGRTLHHLRQSSKDLLVQDQQEPA